MEHHHEHVHSHSVTIENPSYFEILEISVRELLVEKGLISADEHRRQIEVLDSRSPALGAKVVAHMPGLMPITRRGFSRMALQPARNWESRCMTIQN